MGVGCWVLVVGCWLLVVACCLLLVACCLLLVVGCCWLVLVVVVVVVFISLLLLLLYLSCICCVCHGRFCVLLVSLCAGHGDSFSSSLTLITWCYIVTRSAFANSVKSDTHNL